MLGRTGGQGWQAGRKRGPKRAANRTPAELERQVLAVRQRLVASPWAQVGAEAIAWELAKLGVEPPPRRTIERIVARDGATRSRSAERRQPKGLPYPTTAVERPGDLHEADLVGHRHLQGGIRFCALNTIDLASHCCGVEIVESNHDERIADAVVSVCWRLGLPARLQLDNGGPFVAPKGLGLVVRLCLHHGVIPASCRRASPAQRRRRALQRRLRHALLPPGALRLAAPAPRAGACF